MCLLITTTSKPSWKNLLTSEIGDFSVLVHERNFAPLSATIPP